MYDRLFLKHREIQVNDTRVSWTDDYTKRVRTFARYPITTLEPFLFGIVLTVEQFEHVFKLYLKTSFTQYFAQVSATERAMCEIISLHKLQNQFMSNNPTPKEILAQKTLVVMMKKRLIYFFLDLDPKDAIKIFYLGNEHGIRESAWKELVDDSASCARAISNVLTVANCYVFLATTEEMIHWGVDFFIITDQNENWCVTVKAGLQNAPFYIEHVSIRPFSHQHDYGAISRRMIFNGTQQMNLEYNESFLAARILVGKPNGDMIDSQSYEEDREKVKHFLKKDRSHKRFDEKKTEAA
mgnify:FL=1